MIFTNITKASKTAQPRAEANRATEGQYILEEGTIFSHQALFFIISYNYLFNFISNGLGIY